MEPLANSFTDSFTELSKKSCQKSSKDSLMAALAKSHAPLLHSLARTHGTPLYVYDMRAIEQNFRSFKQAFSARKSLICYALKANANLSILKLLAELGSGADCVSINEVKRALLAGIPRYKIIFSGVGKRDDEIEEALREDILFLNVESDEELKRIESIAARLLVPESKRARISIRVNPNINPKTHPYISTGLHENKFGVDIESAKQMYLYAHKSSALEPVGIHFHIGSQLTELAPLHEASEKVATLARSLMALGINLRFFDIGGGLGISYENETPIALYDYAQSILSTLSGCDWTIICEPGRRIVGECGLLLTRVIGQKRTSKKRFVIVDAGMNDLMRPALYGAVHQPILLDSGMESKGVDSGRESKGAESSEPESKGVDSLSPADIVGPVCESSDVFCRDFMLPELQSGALIGFDNAGAYGHSMSSSYNARARPAEVGIYTDPSGASSMGGGAKGANGMSGASGMSGMSGASDVSIKLLRRRESFAESIKLELDALESPFIPCGLG